MSIFYIDVHYGVMLIGPVDTDGGGGEINLETGEIRPVPRWGEGLRIAEILAATEALHAATRFKDPHLQKQVAAPLVNFVRKELSMRLG